MKEPIFFPSAKAFRVWLQKHHKTADEVQVGYWRLHARQPTMTWSESVDQALCFGWIDGVKRTVDGDRYTIRFTPRRPGSNWSAINIKKMEALEACGQMRPAGRAAFAKRTEAKSRIYSYEQRKSIALAPALQRRLEANQKAWSFIQAQPPGYQALTRFYVMNAKQEPTRLKRLDRLIALWAAGKRDR